jgi:hypothetical protein
MAGNDAHRCAAQVAHASVRRWRTSSMFDSNHQSMSFLLKDALEHYLNDKKIHNGAAYGTLSD